MHLRTFETLEDGALKDIVRHMDRSCQESRESTEMTECTHLRDEEESDIIIAEEQDQ